MVIFVFEEDRGFSLKVRMYLVKGVVRGRCLLGFWLGFYLFCIGMVLLFSDEDLGVRNVIDV